MSCQPTKRLIVLLLTIVVLVNSVVSTVALSNEQPSSGQSDALLTNPLTQPPSGRWHYYPLGKGVRDIWVDDHGGVWLATEDGLVLFDGHRFTNFYAGPSAQAVGGDNKGHLCIVTDDKRVIFLDELTGQPYDEFEFNFTTDIGPLTDTVTGVLMDSQGNTWFTIVYRGLARFNGQTLEWLHEKLPFNALPTDLVEDQSGVIWVGGMGGIAAYHEDQGWEIHTIETGMIDDDWLGLGVDQQGHLWALDNTPAVVMFDGVKWETVLGLETSQMRGFGSLNLTDVWAHSPQAVWFAPQLLQYDGAEWWFVEETMNGWRFVPSASVNSVFATALSGDGQGIIYAAVRPPLGSRTFESGLLVFVPSGATRQYYTPPNENAPPLLELPGLPYQGGAPGRIAYVDQDYNIWVIDADGSNRRQITFDGKCFGDPTWSFDGQYLACDCRRDEGDQRVDTVRVVDVASLEVVLELSRARFPQWSPIDHCLRYYSHLREKYIILNVDTPADQAIDAPIGEWSPNGKFMARRACAECQEDSGFWLEDCKIQVIDLPSNSVVASAPCLNTSAPIEFSPDSTKVAFVSRDQSIAVMNTDGTKLKTFVSAKIYYPSDYIPDRLLAFSMDGSSVVYIYDWDRELFQDAGIVAIDIDTGVISQIYKFKEKTDYFPHPDGAWIAFSPDGLWVAYSSQPEGYLTIANLYGDERYSLGVQGSNYTWEPIQSLLATKLTHFVEHSQSRIDAMLEEANQAATAGDFFAEKKSEDRATLFFDLAFGVGEAIVSTIELGEAAKLYESPDVFLPGINADEHFFSPGFEPYEKELFFKILSGESYLHKNQIIKILGHGFWEYALDLADAAAEAGVIDVAPGELEGILIDSLTRDGLQKILSWALSQPLPFQSWFQTQLKDKASVYNWQLEEQLGLALTEMPSYTSEEQKIYIQDLDARLEANLWLWHTFRLQNAPLLQAYDKRQNPVWQWELFRALSKWGVPIVFNLVFDGPAWLMTGIKLGIEVTATAYEVYGEDYQKLKEDERMVTHALSATIGARRDMRRIFSNSFSGVYNVRQGIHPQLPQTSARVIGHYSEGYYRVLDRYFWLEKRSYAQLKLENTGGSRTCYDVIADFGHSGMLDELNYHVSHTAACLSPGESTVITIQYKTDNSGDSPDEGSSVTIRIIGTTATGMYRIEELKSLYLPTRIELAGIVSGVALASAVTSSKSPQLDDVETVPYPLHTMLSPIHGTRRYNLSIDVENPFSRDLSVELVQRLSSTWKVVDGGGATINGNELVWSLYLVPGDLHQIDVLLEWLEQGSETIFVEGVQARFYDRSGVEFSIASSPKETPAPASLWNHVVFAGVIYTQMEEAAKVELRNLSASESLDVSAELCISEVGGQPLGCTSVAVEVPPDAQKTLSLPTDLTNLPAEPCVVEVWIIGPQRRELADTELVKLHFPSRHETTGDEQPEESTGLLTRIQLPIPLQWMVLMLCGGLVGLSMMGWAAVQLWRYPKKARRKRQEAGQLLQRGIAQIKNGDVRGGYAMLRRMVEQSPVLNPFKSYPPKSHKVVPVATHPR